MPQCSPMADAAQLAATLGFTILTLAGAVLSFLAYWSIRRADDVVFRARMYMNRKRLFDGFLAVAIGMAVFTIVIFVALVSQALGYQSVPGSPLQVALTIGFLAFFVFLAWGFYNFYALSRPPRGTPAQEARNP